MSNDIVDQITFGTDDASLAAFHFMLHQVRAEGQPLGSIDFNKLIPMPQELDMRAGFQTDQGLKLYMDFQKENAVIAMATLFTPEAECSPIIMEHLAKWDAVEKKDPETWALGKKAAQNIKKYGCPTWVEWCRLNWGSKDNAYCCVPLDKTSDTMTFQTSRSAVPKLVAALSRRFPEQEVTYSWADESTGQHLGRMVFKAGEVIETDIPQEPEELTQATVERSPKKSSHRGRSR